MKNTFESSLAPSTESCLWICALITNYRRFKNYYCSEFTLSIEKLLTIFKGGAFYSRLSAKYLLLVLLIPLEMASLFICWIATFSLFLNSVYCLCFLSARCNVRGFISLILWWESNLHCESELKKDPPLGKNSNAPAIPESVKQLSWMQKHRSLTVLEPCGWFQEQNLDTYKGVLTSKGTEESLKQDWNSNLNNSKSKSSNPSKFYVVRAS